MRQAMDLAFACGSPPAGRRPISPQGPEPNARAAIERGVAFWRTMRWPGESNITALRAIMPGW